jgi:hypothetical protein
MYYLNRKSKNLLNKRYFVSNKKKIMQNVLTAQRIFLMLKYKKLIYRGVFSTSVGTFSNNLRKWLLHAQNATTTTTTTTTTTIIIIIIIIIMLNLRHSAHFTYPSLTPRSPSNHSTISNPHIFLSLCCSFHDRLMVVPLLSMFSSAVGK